MSSNWHDPTAYEYTHAHNLRNWGWEFLRRNSHYKKEWQLELKNFFKRKKSGKLYQDLLGYPNNSQIHDLGKSSKDYEKFFTKHYNSPYNETDPDNFATFEIGSKDAKKWFLSAYQNPRSKFLVPGNQVRSSRFDIVGFEDTEPEITFKAQPYTVTATIDLLIPHREQLKKLDEFIKAQSKTVRRPSLNPNLWIKYLRCLDARSAKIKKSEACKHIFRSVNPDEKWDEALKQAKLMVSSGYIKLLS